jgi:hypothetical protein
MVRYALRLRAVVSAAAVSILIGVAGASPARAADPVDAHLQAGEFGPALAAAAVEKNPAVRDEALGKIAAAQAAAGAGHGAIGSIGEMHSDLARLEALKSVGKEGGFFGPGGGVVADFDPLIDLITTTIAPESWTDVGGPGAIREFASGVYVDPTSPPATRANRPSSARCPSRASSGRCSCCMP